MLTLPAAAAAEPPGSGGRRSHLNVAHDKALNVGQFVIVYGSALGSGWLVGALVVGLPEVLPKV